MRRSEAQSSGWTVSRRRVGFRAFVKLSAVTSVILSLLENPLSETATRSGVPQVGAMVSTVSVVEVVAELPAASVATAVTASAPWPAGVTDVVQCPVPSTVTAAR